VGLPHIGGDYMGEHWLASFAVLALDEMSIERTHAGDDAAIAVATPAVRR
jgi:hypothetical protein